jgi:Tol biopolymer transport system component
VRRPLALGILALAALPAAAAPGDTTRLSVSSAGAQPTAAANGAAVSADGRFVAFTSRAGLTAAGGNGALQLYVRDRVQGRTLLVSSSPAGQLANGDVVDDPLDRPYGLSGDGRYAVFASSATNLSAADANGAARDVFRKDLSTGAVILVSRASGGQQANAGVGGDPDISADGIRVAFTTGDATNLFPGDPGTESDVVVRDVEVGTTTLVNAGPGGAAIGPAGRPSISADGRFVAFEAGAAASGLVDGDLNGASDVLVRDLVAGVTARASVAADGSAPGGATSPDLSGDGRYVVFLAATPHTAGTPARPNVYRRDMKEGLTVLASAKHGTAGDGGDGDASSAAISADGTRIAFDTASTDLVPGDLNGAVRDAVVRDPATLTTRRVGLSGGVQAGDATTLPVVAPGGGVVAFGYDDGPSGTPLVPGDANALPDVFSHELAPTDDTPPALAVTQPADRSTTADRAVAVAASATDPSGIVSVTVNGRRAVRTGDAFSGQVLLAAGANSVTVTALDGSGNVSRVVRSVTRLVPGRPPGTLAVRATRLRVRLTGRVLRLWFRLPAPCVVRVDAVRIVPRGPRRQPLLQRIAGPRRAAMRAGGRGMVFRVRRLPAGTYRARVTVISAGGLARTVRTFRVVQPGARSGAARRP